MVFKFIPSPHGVGEASVLAVADSKIQDVAQQIFDEAQRLARAEGLSAYADSMRITTGARPKGRGFREVIADDPDGEKYEWGDSDTERRRILGQAAGVQINVQGNGKTGMGK